MLSELSIENFAIIDRLLVRFYPGFTVLTGETGAGKSIIIDALQAALGARTPSDVVRADARVAAVEAVFDWPDDGQDETLGGTLRELGIEDEGCLILRREITSAGRSTARINGRAVPLSALVAIGSSLVDIHGQSDHLSILRHDRQLDALDRYGGLVSLRQQVAAALTEYSRLRQAREDLAQGQRELEQRLDLLRFQHQEISGANLRPDEEEELEAERHLLFNAEKLTELSTTAYDALHGEAQAALDGVTRAASALRDLAGIDPSLAPLAERLQASQYELDDLGQDIRRYRDAVEYDPRRLNEIEDRLDLLARLKRKYGATVDDVIAFGARVAEELDNLESFDQRLAELTEESAAAEEQAGTLAAELTRQRMATARSLVEAMRGALRGLGLQGTDFDIEVWQTEAADGLTVPGGKRLAHTQSGVDSLRFVVSFNPGEPLRPLERIASGGETSRFLLALKSVLAEADRTPTLIFDEVDIGVGGRRGMDVGERMRSLSRDHQVISITHLPQIAALADQHLSAGKNIAEGRTTTVVRELGEPERVAEIAEMMSGTGTEMARRNALELLEAAQQGKSQPIKSPPAPILPHPE